MQAYGRNRKSEQPFRLIVCGIYQQLNDSLEKISGYENWNCVKSSQRLPDLFDLAPIMTADNDSDNVEQTLLHEQSGIGESIRLSKVRNVAKTGNSAFHFFNCLRCLPLFNRVYCSVNNKNGSRRNANAASC